MLTQRILTGPVKIISRGIQQLTTRENGYLLLWLLLLHYSLGYPFKLIYVLSAFSGMLLLLNTGKGVYQCLVLLLTVAGALYAPVGIIYGYPDINVTGSLMYTNSREAHEFLGNIPLTAWLLSFSVVVSGIAAVLSSLYVSKDRVRTRRGNRWLFILFLVPALWSPVRQGQLLSSGLPEVRFIHDAYTSYQAVRDSSQHFARIISTGSIWKPESLPGQRDTYILVIGESARRDYLHAFGGQYPNTPWLDNAPATLFTNYESAGPSTVLSLTSTLARRQGNVVELNNNVIALASRAGFETWWLSNQGKKGHFDSPVALIGENAGHVQFIKSTSSDDRQYSPDDQLLPMLEQALTSGRGKKLIILHLMGSHPQACVRTANRYDIDVGAKDISCYIKSIAMTDQLLGQIQGMAEREGGNWSMMYFSDHGLSYVNKNTSGAYLTHGDKSRENYNVPFFIIDKNQTTRTVITVQRSGFDFLKMFSQWLKIRDPQIAQTCDMISTQDCHPVHQVLNFQGQLTNYDTLPSVP
ncbi:sulfatase-like hydrolase/transferase [Kosakonia quasisacchari]|uniref:sulfatase-like hydrolase/transferase n=1 Tax=Kosakonia quasisacchari TaxID=2529380 RepID=UPI0039E1050F